LTVTAACAAKENAASTKHTARLPRRPRRRFARDGIFHTLKSLPLVHETDKIASAIQTRGASYA